MAVPKRRTSKSKKRKRRTHYKAVRADAHPCPKCGEPASRTSCARTAATTAARRCSRSRTNEVIRDRARRDGGRPRSGGPGRPERWQALAGVEDDVVIQLVGRSARPRGGAGRAARRPHRIEIVRGARGHRDGARSRSRPSAASGELVHPSASRLQRDGHSDAFISAGNTGAVMAGCDAHPPPAPRLRAARHRHAVPHGRPPGAGAGRRRERGLLPAGAGAASRTSACVYARDVLGRANPARGAAQHRRGGGEGQCGCRRRRTGSSRRAASTSSATSRDATSCVGATAAAPSTSWCATASSATCCSSSTSRSPTCSTGWSSARRARAWPAPRRCQRIWHFLDYERVRRRAAARRRSGACDHLPRQVLARGDPRTRSAWRSRPPATTSSST